MPGIIQHVFRSGIADGTDGTQVQPQGAWNNQLQLISGNHGSILVRDTTDATYGSNYLASVTTGQILLSQGAGVLPVWTATPTLSTSLTIGSGDEGTLGAAGNQSLPQRLEIFSGSVASPNLVHGPALKISKFDAIPLSDVVNANTCEQWSNITCINRQNATSQVGGNAGFFGALTYSTSVGAGFSNDTQALIGWGYSLGNGRGIGFYAEGGRSGNAGKTNGLEARSTNNGSADTWSPSANSNTISLLGSVGGGAAADSAVGLTFYSVLAGVGYDVGIGFGTDGSASYASIRTAAFADYSSATSSIVIGGAHTNAIVTKAGGGITLLGSATGLANWPDSTAQLQIYQTASSNIACVASGVNSEIDFYSYGAIPTLKGFGVGGTLAAPTATPNTQVIARLGACGWDTALTTPRARLDAVATQLWANGATGTAWKIYTTPNGSGTAGLRLTIDDTGLTLADAHNLVTGTTTGMKIGTLGGASGQKLGFFNQTPIVQPLLATGAAHTADDIITTLQNLGLVRQS